MKRLLISAAILTALAVSASAQCDWRDFRDAKLYVEYFGEADVSRNPVKFYEHPLRCDDNSYICFDGEDKVYFYHDGRQDIYYVDYSRRSYTILDVVDDHRADYKVSSFQIVQCEPNTITVWTSDGIANICRPSSHVDYRFNDYHSFYDRPPHPNDHFEHPHDDHPDHPHDDHFYRPHDDRFDHDHSDGPEHSYRDQNKQSDFNGRNNDNRDFNGRNNDNGNKYNGNSNGSQYNGNSNRNDNSSRSSNNSNSQYNGNNRSSHGNSGIHSSANE